MTQPPESEPDHAYGLGPEETASEAVIAAVAESTDQSPLEMDRLAETIDPDMLDRVFDTQDDQPSSVIVAFEYCSRHVTVTSSEVRIDE